MQQYVQVRTMLWCGTDTCFTLMVQRGTIPTCTEHGRNHCIIILARVNHDTSRYRYEKLQVYRCSYQYITVHTVIKQHLPVHTRLCPEIIIMGGGSACNFAERVVCGINKLNQETKILSSQILAYHSDAVDMNENWSLQSL
jgi:hypothetical protein